MNGHHESCECQSCTIGREIGFDVALGLLAELSELLSGYTVRDYRANKALAATQTFLDEHKAAK